MSYPKFYLYKQIVQAKLYIDSHFGDPIDLDNIADQAYFSKFHFIRLFKSIYGSTPHKYLTRVRMEKAKEFLQSGRPVTEVCFEVGFDSVSSFTGLFKRHAGITPSSYQHEYLARQEEIKKAPLQFIPNCFAEQKGWIKE
jgi:AraC-like DNA-binding protein